MNKKKRQLQAKSGNQSISISQEEDYSLPSPEILDKYKEIGILDFILDYTKKEQHSRLEFMRNRDKRIYKLGRTEFILNAMGLVLATIIILSFFAGSIYLISIDKPALGATSIVLAFISLITTIIRRR